VRRIDSDDENGSRTRNKILNIIVPKTFEESMGINKCG